MNNLFESIRNLIKSNSYISSYIDENIRLLNEEKEEIVDTLNRRNFELYEFIELHNIKVEEFKQLLDNSGYTSINDIRNNYVNISEEEIKLLNNFELSVKIGEEKVKMYLTILSNELNMINKIKHFASNNKIDFKI